MTCTVTKTHEPKPTDGPGSTETVNPGKLAAVIDEAVRGYDDKKVSDLTSKLGKLAAAIEKAGGLNDSGQFSSLVNDLKSAKTREEKISALQDLSNHLQQADFSMVSDDQGVQAALAELTGEAETHETGGPEETPETDDNQDEEPKDAQAQRLAAHVADVAKRHDENQIALLTENLGNLVAAIEKAGGQDDDGEFAKLVESLKAATTSDQKVRVLNDLSTYLKTADFSGVASDNDVKRQLEFILPAPEGGAKGGV
jgi:hypothetical protein